MDENVSPSPVDGNPKSAEIHEVISEKVNTFWNQSKKKFVFDMMNVYPVGKTMSELRLVDSILNKLTANAKNPDTWMTDPAGVIFNEGHIDLNRAEKDYLLAFMDKFDGYMAQGRHEVFDLYENLKL